MMRLVFCRSISADAGDALILSTARTDPNYSTSTCTRTVTGLKHGHHLVTSRTACFVLKLQTDHPGF